MISLTRAPKWFTKANYSKWLFSQPDRLSFDYLSNGNCQFAQFIKHQTGRTDIGVGGADTGRIHIGVDDYDIMKDYPFPKWAIEVERYIIDNYTTNHRVIPFSLVKEAFNNLK